MPVKKRLNAVGYISVMWFLTLPLNTMFSLERFSSFFKVYFIDYAITVVPFISPLCSPPPAPPSPQHSSPLSSRPWVVHISFLASPFPILFLTSPCLFCTYLLCFLIPAPFLLSSYPLITLHMVSIPMILLLFWLFA